MTYWLGNIGDLHRFTAIYRDYTLKGFDLVASRRGCFDLVSQVHRLRPVVNVKVGYYASILLICAAVLRIEDKLGGWVKADPLLKISCLHHLQLFYFLKI